MNNSIRMKLVRFSRNGTSYTLEDASGETTAWELEQSHFGYYLYNLNGNNNYCIPSDIAKEDLFPFLDFTYSGVFPWCRSEEEIIQVLNTIIKYNCGEDNQFKCMP